MKRFALLALLVITAAGAAPQANATKGWHRCQLSMEGGLGSLCDGRGRVLFPWVGEVNARSSYAQIVRGFRRTSSRRAIVDTHADWGGASRANVALSSGTARTGSRTSRSATERPMGAATGAW